MNDDVSPPEGSREYDSTGERPKHKSEDSPKVTPLHQSCHQTCKERLQGLCSYTQCHWEETMVILLLLFGLLCLLFFHSLLGGLIIGVVGGYYFADEIIYYVRNMGEWMRNRGQLRYGVLAVLLIAFFIAAPGIFIGAAISSAFKRTFGDS